MRRFVAEDAELKATYQNAKEAYARYFDTYFGSGKVKAERKGKGKGKDTTGEAAADGGQDGGTEAA